MTIVNFAHIMSRNRGESHYNLADVKSMAKGIMGGFSIEPGAEKCASDHFGWQMVDIVDAICRLKRKHFWKSAPHDYLPGEIVDVYHAHRLKGMCVYLHLHIVVEGNEPMLIIGSCKELEE